MNISLPETLGTWVAQQARQEGYNSADAYVQELLRRERERRDKEALEQRLLRALDSGAPVEVTSAFWEEPLERSSCSRSGRSTSRSAPTDPRPRPSSESA